MPGIQDLKAKLEVETNFPQPNLEYTILDTLHWTDQGALALERALNKLGAAGWMVCGTFGAQILFVRHRSPVRPKTAPSPFIGEETEPIPLEAEPGSEAAAHKAIYEKGYAEGAKRSYQTPEIRVIGLKEAK